MRRLGISLGSFILIAFAVGTVVDCSTGADSRSNETPEESSNNPTIILRKKRLIRYEDLPLSIRKRLARNLETIADYEDDLDDEDPESIESLGRQSRRHSEAENDFEDHSVDKRAVMTNEEETNNRQVEEMNPKKTMPSKSRVKRDKDLHEDLRKKVKLELAKSQLERVEKKVENEIKSLKKRSKSAANTSQSERDSKKRQIMPNISAHPRLLKIEVDTFEIGRESPKEPSDNVDRLKKSEIDYSPLQSKIQIQRDVGREATTSENRSEAQSGSKFDPKAVEDQLQRRIDAVKEKIKREIEENVKIKEIEANNAKYDELMRLVEAEDAVRDNEREKRLEEDLPEESANIDGVEPENTDVAEEANSPHSSIEKRSVALDDDLDDSNVIEEEIKLKRKGNPKTRKFRKSILPLQKYGSHGDSEVYSDLETEKSEIIDGERRWATGTFTLDYFWRRYDVRAQANRFVRRSQGLGEGKRRLKHSKFSGIEDGRKSFLFPGRLYARQRREMNSRGRQVGSRRRRISRGGRARDKHRRRRGRQRKERRERAADEPLGEVQADSVADTNSLMNIENAQDLGSQLAPEYQEAFGGLPSEPKTALARYKRVKRTS